jgi:sporulation-control protein spo0M
MAKMKNGLYRGAYAIGIYEVIDETLVALVNNAEELSTYLNINRRATDVLLCNIFNNKQRHVRLNNRHYELAFIKMV